MSEADESDQEVFKKPERFIWTDANVVTLLDIYEKYIDQFLSKTANQSKLWEKLVTEMKSEVHEDYRDRLTGSKAKNKFFTLQKKFKEKFFNSDDPGKFRFYDKMNKMLTGYATRKLNETNHNWMDPNETNLVYTTIIIDALNSSSMSADDENSESNASIFVEDEEHKKYKLKPSQMTLIQKKIAKLPKTEVCIQKEKMRIDPNTPFNRNINNTTLLDQKISFANSQRTYSRQFQKRRCLENDPEFVAKKPKNVLRMNSTEVNNHSKSVIIVEALDECEISNIEIHKSKTIFQDVNSKQFSQMSSLKFDKTSENSTGAQKVAARPKAIFKRPAIINKSAINNSSNIQASSSNSSKPKTTVIKQLESTLESSIVVPSFHLSSTENSYSLVRDDQQPDEIVQFEISEVSPQNEMKIVAPKKDILREIQYQSPENNYLIKKLRENPQISIKSINVAQKEQEAPGWFKSFLEKYEEDKKAINDKLDFLLARL